MTARSIETYRPGDCIAGATSGIAVYFDILHLDADGKPVYSADGVRVRTLTLFVVIAHGVFVTYKPKKSSWRMLWAVRAEPSMRPSVAWRYQETVAVCHQFLPFLHLRK